MIEPHSTTTVSHVVASDLATLDRLGANIRDRDEQLRTSAQRNWFDNGTDLILAKSLQPHGGFEEWCRTEINYSLRTAEKLMGAVRTFEPLLKSEPGSVLPPPSLVYALSAPSVPPEIRDNFAPRLIAGEAVGKEMRRVIREHREKVKKAKRRETLSQEEQAQQDRRDQARAKREARDEEQRKVEQERQASARSAAVDLIVTRLGEDLTYLFELAAQAGPSGIFSFPAQRELEARAQAHQIQPNEADLTTASPTAALGPLSIAATPVGTGEGNDPGKVLDQYYAVIAKQRANSGRQTGGQRSAGPGQAPGEQSALS